MGEVYKFNVKLIGLEEIMWRDIEISSLSTLAKLSYAVLAAFDCKGTHLFNINLREQRYEIIFGDEDDYFNQLPIDPRGIKLEKIKLEIGETLLLEYNYGASWEFEIELLSISKMKRGMGTHYPNIVDGKDRGIIEDMSTYDMKQIIEEIDLTGNPYELKWNGLSYPWDYKNFDLKYWKSMLKGKISLIEDNYEYL